MRRVKRNNMRIIRYIFTGVILLLGVGFACLNAEIVQVNFYIKTYQLPLSLLLVLILGLGMIIGFLGFGGQYYRLKRESGRLKSQLKSVEQEVSQLRMMPLKNDTLEAK